MATLNTKGTKRVQVDKDKTVIFVTVAAAAVISVMALMISKGIWSQSSYLGKVADQKEVAVRQLKANKASADQLKSSYDAFKSQSPNLIGGSATGEGPRDGDNARLVLDALPSKYDFPALTTSLEQLLFGYKVNGIVGNDDVVIQQANTTSAPVEIPVTVDFTANYDGVKTLIDTFDKSIRPFHITRLEFRGSNSNLQTTFAMKTFYQPEKTVEITKKEVQ